MNEVQQQIDHPFLVNMQVSHAFKLPMQEEAENGLADFWSLYMYSECTQEHEHNYRLCLSLLPPFHCIGQHFT